MSRARNIADTGDNNLDDIVVDGSGNVGIGTSSPFSTLSTSVIANAPSTSGNMASHGATIHNGSGGRAVQIGVNETGAYNYIQSSYVNNANVGVNLAFFTGASEAMRIDSNGNVGIGTDSPTEKLHIEGGANTRLKFDYTSNWEASIGIDGAAGALTFENVDGSERMRIDSGGSLRLGTTGTEGITNRLTVKFAGGGSEYGMVMKPAADNTVPIYFQNASGGNVGSIGITASSTSYNTTSDYRLKENVTDISDATTRLKQLNPVRFNFISNPEKVVDGFLAHEVQDVVPEAISGTKDAMRDEEYEVTPAVLDEDGNVVTEAVMGTRSVPDYQGIDQSKLVPLLVKTIQELEARIAALENV